MRRLCCLAIVAAGCSSFVEQRAASTTYRVLLKSREAAQRQADIELARDAMPGGLLQIEAFALAYPDHRGFRELYAEASCQYAVGFVFDDWEDAKLGGRADEAGRIARRLGPLLTTCIDANRALLAPAWRAGETSVLLATARRDDVPALLWIATAGSVALAIDPMRHLAELPEITATLTRCAELAPGYHDASAELLLATLAAARGQVFGGEDGAELFARARQRAGEGALLVDVMFARGSAVARKDRPLFETTLHHVLDADVTRWPERRLANELAARKARRYLAAESVLLP